ncbi:hypothetical protein NDU88_007535 [Pleurodeles waltl]|uniref:Coiled-coil domain-containing protein 137 n=1 Tax=Pleurodeles waltl TaxID=8319 RepID=A0AAV7PMW8_PLEWA|nr:hypothetical protein NDU88_007535 [Pleurodeles waltl]
MGKQSKIKAVDPFCPASRKQQMQQRNEKKKVNAKPKHLDHQEIPFKLRELLKSQKQMTQPKKKRRRKVAFSDNNSKDALQEPRAPNAPLDILVPKFKRQKRETVHNYIQRMDSVSNHVMFLTNNQPVREPEKEVVLTEETKQEKPKTKEFDRRRKARALQKKAEKKVDQLEKEVFQDRVKFGEVAMEPPSFTAVPRKSVGIEKPGERQLLLKNIFKQQNASTIEKKSQLPSMARQRIMEEERERVVQAYRALKKQKQLHHKSTPLNAC